MSSKKPHNYFVCTMTNDQRDRMTLPKFQWCRWWPLVCFVHNSRNRWVEQLQHVKLHPRTQITSNVGLTWRRRCKASTENLNTFIFLSLTLSRHRMMFAKQFFSHYLEKKLMNYFCRRIFTNAVAKLSPLLVPQDQYSLEYQDLWNVSWILIWYFLWWWDLQRHPNLPLEKWRLSTCNEF